MARYIDADKLIAHLEDEIKGCEKPFGSRANGKSIAYGTALGLKSAISFAQTLPDADVVPKSEVVLASSDAVKMLIDCHGYALTHDADIKEEVAREIFEEIEAEIKAALESNYRAKSQYNPTDEFSMWVQGKLDALGGIEYFIAELKKKYTE